MFIKLIAGSYGEDVVLNTDKIFSCAVSEPTGQMVITDDVGKEHSFPLGKYFVSRFLEDLQGCKGDLRK